MINLSSPESQTEAVVNRMVNKYMKIKRIISAICVITAWSAMFYFVFLRHLCGYMQDYIPLYVASKITTYSPQIHCLMYDHNPESFSKTSSATLALIAQNEGVQVDGFTPYVYPPFFAWQLKPLTYFPFNRSKIIFNLLSALFFIVCIPRCARSTHGRL